MFGFRRFSLLTGLLVGASSLSPAQSAPVARDSAVVALAGAPRTAAHRIAAGEHAAYDVRLTGHVVGTGSLDVLGEETLNGNKTLHAALQITGGLLFAKVDDRFDSWIDADSIFSRRFIQDQHELGHRRYREYDLSPELKSYRQVDNGEVNALTTSQPLDDVAMLFYARTLALHVGDVDTIPRYFKSGRNVIVKVLRKERVQVPAGTFETIVVQPTITNAGGLFGQGGQALLYFSDDSARTLIMLRSHVPVMGSLTLVLKDFHAAP